MKKNKKKSGDNDLENIGNIIISLSFLHLALILYVSIRNLLQFAEFDLYSAAIGDYLYWIGLDIYSNHEWIGLRNIWNFFFFKLDAFIPLIIIGLFLRENK